MDFQFSKRGKVVSLSSNWRNDAAPAERFRRIALLFNVRKPITGREKEFVTSLPGSRKTSASVQIQIGRFALMSLAADRRYLVLRRSYRVRGDTVSLVRRVFQPRWDGGFWNLHKISHRGRTSLECCNGADDWIFRPRFNGSWTSPLASPCLWRQKGVGRISLVNS
jgi:hypothetical protein